MDPGEIGFVFLPAFVCILAGVILSAISAARHEKWWALGLMGFILNAGVIVVPIVVRSIWPDL
jgi:hypothetical protein